MDAALDKVAAAVDKAEPAVEKAVRSALGDKAGDAVHTAAEHLKDALKDDVSLLFCEKCCWSCGRGITKIPLSHSLLFHHPFQSTRNTQAKRAQISEVAGKAQAKVQELVGEAKK